MTKDIIPLKRLHVLVFSLGRRRTRCGLIGTFKIMNGLSSIKCEEPFTPTIDRFARGRGLGLQRNHIGTQMGTVFFSNRVIPLCIRLLEHAVNSYNIDGFKEALKACLGGGKPKAKTIDFR